MSKKQIDAILLNIVNCRSQIEQQELKLLQELLINAAMEGWIWMLLSLKDLILMEGAMLKVT